MSQTKPQLGEQTRVKYYVLTNLVESPRLSVRNFNPIEQLWIENKGVLRISKWMKFDEPEKRQTTTFEFIFWINNIQIKCMRFVKLNIKKCKYV